MQKREVKGNHAKDQEGGGGMSIQHINVELIRQDGGTQARAAMDAPAIEEYALAMAEGGDFPPVVVFQEGEVYWLGDGFHRVTAHIKAFGFAPIAADVREGGLREALLFATGANGDHGVRRTIEDKRKAVSKMLMHEEFCQWSDRQIAKHCKVTHPFVSGLRNPKGGNVTTPETNNHISKQEQFQEMEREATENVCTFPDDFEHRKPSPEDINQQRPKPAPRPVLSGEEAAEILALRQENTDLKDQLAEMAQLMKDTMEENDSMHRIMDAEDLQAQFKAEVARFMELARVTTARNNALISEVNDLKHFAKMWRGKYETLAAANKAAGMEVPA